MIPDLRQALRTEADQAPVYAVYERALRTARRRRRSRLGAVAAAIAVLIVIVVAGVPGLMVSRLADPRWSSTGSDPSLPDRLGYPPAFWPSVTTDPPGRSALIVGGQAFPVDTLDRLAEDEGDFAVVGATSDVYRMWRVTGYEAHAGEDVLISPDGLRLAIPSGMNRAGAAIADLKTGEISRLTAFTADDYVTPAAWSPDGTSLVVEVYRSGQPSELGLVGVPGGAFRKLAVLDESARRGYLAAFSPDGSLVAYRDGDRIGIASTDPVHGVSRSLAVDGAWLAGKGAWSPDGDVMTWRLDQGRWRLEGRDPETGRRQGREWTVEATGLTAVRLLGWAAGRPVIAAFRKEPTAPVESTPVTAYQEIYNVEVWRLTEAGHDVLMTTPHNMMSIDIADEVITGGRTRPGDPPRFGVLTVTGVIILAGGLAWAVRRTRRPLRTGL